MVQARQPGFPPPHPQRGGRADYRRPTHRSPNRRRGQHYPDTPGLWWQRLGIVVLAVGLVYGGWQTYDSLNRHTPPPVVATPTPVTVYSLDEQARLLFTYDALLDMEKGQGYGELYDTLTSAAFRETIDRPTFLAMADCADLHLGLVEGYHRPTVRLRRRPVISRSAKSKQYPLDEVSAQVNRKIDPVWEKVVLRPHGMAYEVDGYYWSAPYPPFQGCLKGVLRDQATRRALETQGLKPDYSGSGVVDRKSAIGN